MSTVHTSAASLYRAILSDAADSGDDDYGHAMPEWRQADEGEMADYTDFECHDVRKVESLQERARGKVAMHGCEHPGRRPDVRVTYTSRMPDGVRSSMTVRRTRARLLALADTVRIKWALYGGGPVPADLLKPKAAKRAVTWPASIVKVWLQQFEDKDYAGAMLTGERLDAVFYPGAKGCAFILAAPIQVEGLPEGVCSARRNDGKWVVACMQSGRAIESRGYGSRKTAEESAISEVARVGLDKLTAALERNRADAVDHDEARAAWCKACNIDDPREPAPVAQPAPESEEGAESADDWAARMVAMVAQPAAPEDVAQPEELTDRARAVVYAAHCRTAAIAREVAPDALADGVRLRRSVNEAGFNAASMALRCSVAQAVRAARRGPVARDVAPDVDEVARIVGVMAGKPDAAADLRARADNMRAGVRQGMQWPGAVQGAAADLTMARARVYDAAADAIDARPGPDAAQAAPVAPVAHAAPPVVQAAGPVVAPSVDALYAALVALDQRILSVAPAKYSNGRYGSDIESAARSRAVTPAMRQERAALKAAIRAATPAPVLPPHTFEAALIGADSQRLESFTYTCAGPGLASADIKGANDRLQSMATARGLRVVMQGFSDGGAKAWAEPKAQPWAPIPAPAPVAAPAPSAPPVGVSAPPVAVSTDPDAAMMREAAERAQVLADGIKAAAGDDPATMARMLRRESARVKAAARGMPSGVAAGYLTTADMLEHAAELHADAMARAPIPARQAQPCPMVQTMARRPGMARCGPVARHWSTGPGMARRPGGQARHGPAAPRMLPPAAAPPVMASAPPVAKFFGIN